MGQDVTQVNRQLLSLADKYWQQQLSQDDYRRLRRRVICDWSGEKDTEGLADMDATQPLAAVRIVVEERPSFRPRLLTLACIGLALLAAGALVAFVGR